VENALPAACFGVPQNQYPRRAVVCESRRQRRVRATTMNLCAKRGYGSQLARRVRAGTLALGTDYGRLTFQHRLKPSAPRDSTDQSPNPDAAKLAGAFGEANTGFKNLPKISRVLNYALILVGATCLSSLLKKSWGISATRKRGPRRNR
jgi:hypothetical protein